MIYQAFFICHVLHHSFVCNDQLMEKLVRSVSDQCPWKLSIINYVFKAICLVM